jgi:hypothetical protein
MLEELITGVATGGLVPRTLYNQPRQAMCVCVKPHT